MKWYLIALVLVLSIVLSSTPTQAITGLNNPGNIEKGDPWKGLTKDQPHKRFAKFKSPVYGYRAMAKVLLTYQRKYKLSSVSQMIQRYAPMPENPTGSYIWYVANENGFTTWSFINLENENVLFWMVRAMAKFEQGKHFNDSDETIRAGVRMALSGN